MKIALCSDNFYPETSGISDSIITTAKELAKRGHQIAFFVPAYGAKDYARVGIKNTAEIDLGPNIQIIRFRSLSFPTGTGQGRFVIPIFFRLGAFRKFQPDVIHSQLFFGVGLEGLFASRLLGVPLVGTNHTAIKEFLRYNPIQFSWINNSIVRYANWYYARCATVTAPSKSVFKEMGESGFKKDGIVLSNPIDTAIFAPLPDRPSLRKKWKLGPNTIVHAGRLAKERSIEVIIQALPLVRKEIPNAQLVIVGRGTNENNLRLLAKELGVGEAVVFPGFVPQEDMPKIMNTGKVFAITSTADTQSLVMMQAMACGIPVVGVNARALPEYISPENGFVVEPGDHKALAKRLVEIMKSPTLQKKLGDGGRKTALQFSPETIASRWETIYQEAIERRARR